MNNEIDNLIELFDNMLEFAERQLLFNKQINSDLLQIQDKHNALVLEFKALKKLSQVDFKDVTVQ